MNSAKTWNTLLLLLIQLLVLPREAGESAPPIIAGFTEGLLAPIFELVIVSILSAFTQATQGTQVSSTPFILFGIFLFLIDLARNVGLGLSHSQFALGSIIGNIFGLYLFYAEFSQVVPTAANDSLIYTVALTVSFVIGIILMIRS